MYTGAGIIIWRPKRNGGYEVLLGQRRINPGRGTWSLFGGGREKSELGRETAIRELREELKFRKAYLRKMRGKLKLRMFPHRIDTIKIPFVFNYKVYAARATVRFPVKEVRVCSEFKRVSWFDVDNLPANMHWGLERSIRKLVSSVQNFKVKDGGRV